MQRRFLSRPGSLLAVVALALPLATAAHQAGGAGHAGPRTGSHAGTPATEPEQQPWGIAAKPGQARRTIDIRMTDDMRFTPDRLRVREGEVVQLRVINAGRVMHELVIGTRQALDEHAEMMRKHPNMEHDEPHMAHVAPGRTGTLVWHFNRPGEFDFACLIPGHYQAGMVGRITVVPKSQGK